LALALLLCVGIGVGGGVDDELVVVLVPILLPVAVPVPTLRVTPVLTTFGIGVTATTIVEDPVLAPDALVDMDTATDVVPDNDRTSGVGLSPGPPWLIVVPCTIWVLYRELPPAGSPVAPLHVGSWVL
jgi:hypothetical protein